MALKIERGRRHTPVKGILAGIEGVGKSTMASDFPLPVFLDTEDGSNHLDVARIRIGSWEELRATVAEIGSQPSEFKTVVIDSADWGEKLLVEQLLKDNKWASIESAGYGKGYTMLAEHFGRFLTQCDAVTGVGLHVIFTAHTKVQRVSPPDMTDGYDRYELKMSKQVSPLLREWADLQLFCTFDTTIVEGSDGRKKAAGGRRRVMHTEPSAAWSAKNRFGLPAKLPMTIESLAPIFAEPARRPGWRDRVAAATTLEELGRIGDDADQAASDGKLTPELRLKLAAAIDDRKSEIETAVTA